jgi:hypothetical protein
MVIPKLEGRKLKRLFWDIEVSPNVVLAFAAGYDQNINYDAIVQERKIICIGYKWEGEKKVNDDRELIRDFLLVASAADELVAHYGDRFDVPWFRTRCLMLRLDPTPVLKTIDTKAWASKNFYFNSNKLDYISRVLGHGGKEKMEFEDWKLITMFNDKKALDKMCHYCGVDVEKLEKVYHDLARYVKPKTHVGVLSGGENWTCPRTGSRNVTKDKTRVSASGSVTHQMKNLDTGTYFTINDSAHKNYLAAKKKNDRKGT